MSDTRTYYAKVENGIVTDVRVVSWDFLIANPDRYGDSSVWVECFQNGLGRGYAGVGFTYDSVNDVFVAPVSPDIESEV